MKIKKKVVRGFTLAELMVTVAITVILLGILFNVANLATKTMETATAKVDREENASNILDAIGTDIETIVVVPGNDNAWLSIGDLSADTWNGTTNDGVLNSAGLCFYTAARDRYDGDIGGTGDNGGDVSCVAYQLFWRNDLNKLVDTNNSETQDKIYAFYRSLIDPDDTYTDALGEDDVRVEMLDGTDMVGAKDFADMAQDIIGTNVYEMSVTFEVEYLEGTEKKTQIVNVVPRGTAGTGTGTWAQITGTGFISDADILDGSATFEDAVDAGDIYAVKALNMTVTLNIMDDVTQSQSGVVANTTGNNLSREKILQGCRAFSRTFQLPQF